MQAFVGVAMNQLLNVLDKLGYRKILEKNCAPPLQPRLSLRTAQNLSVIFTHFYMAVSVDGMSYRFIPNLKKIRRSIV